MNTPHETRDKITPKPVFRPSIDLMIWTIIAIQIIIAIYGFVVLPDTVPIHWGPNGQANGYGPKWVDTFLFPLISIGLYLLIRWLLAVGPRLGGRENTAANRQIGKLVLAGLMLFMLIIQLSALAQTLAVGFNMITVIMLAVSVLFIFLGNYMGKIRRNFWMGVRTPWTLTSDVVWERTHRLGGWLFVAIGLIGIPCSFVPALRLWVIFSLVILAAIILYVYSYVCYQQNVREEDEPVSPPFDEANEM